MYADMGFSRIIPGRELSLMEISEIKYALPELEIETFIHGAMCLAYSGRCFLSSWMADRSANKGDCSHSCRWNYQLLRRGDLALEESKRPGEYYPVLEGEGFTTIMSSKDICMIDHIDKLYDAGIDSVKIEGRMKSMYYAAMVTRAYRKEIDRVKAANADPSTTEAYRRELYKVSHREFTTGFYFDREEIQKPNAISYERSHTFLGVIRERLANGRWLVDVKNQIRPTDRLEYIGPDILYIEDEGFTLYDAQGDPLGQADHGKYCELESDADIKPGYFIRREIPGLTASIPAALSPAQHELAMGDLQAAPELPIPLPLAPGKQEFIACPQEFSKGDIGIRRISLAPGYKRPEIAPGLGPQLVHQRAASPQGVQGEDSTVALPVLVEPDKSPVSQYFTGSGLFLP
jgi:hypothetical protein